MKKNSEISVSVVIGSDSDSFVMEETIGVLKEFGIPHKVFLTSAHRSPERTLLFAREAAKQGIRVIIVGAGAAAHLAGVIASQTYLPVIGVPIDSTPLGGLDALLSTIQMPGGVPVATMAVGKAGAKNAAIMAIRILALQDDSLRRKLETYIANMAEEIERKQETLNVDNTED
jgi:phosphoribosylaminoimidazole carboxylase PurE protein